MELEYCKEKFMEKVEERLLDFTLNVFRKGSNGVVFEKGKYYIDAKYMNENRGMYLNLHDCGGRTALTIWCIDEIKNGVKNPYRFKINIENFVKYFDSYCMPCSIKQDYGFFATRFYNAIEVICRKHDFAIDRHCGTTNISFNLYCNCIDKDTFNKEVDRIYGIIEEILVEVNTQVALEYYEQVELEKKTLAMFKIQAESSRDNLKPKAVVYSCYKNNKNELVIMKGNKVVATISDCPSDTRVMNSLANDVLYDLGYIKEDYF